MAALQLVLVCFTLVALLGLLPLLYFVGHWYLVQRSPLDAWDSPQRSLSRCWSSFGRNSPIARTGSSTPGSKLGRGVAAEAPAGEQIKADASALEGACEDAQDAELRRRLASGDAAAAEGAEIGWLGICQVGCDAAA